MIVFFDIDKREFTHLSAGKRVDKFQTILNSPKKYAEFLEWTICHKGISSDIWDELFNKLVTQIDEGK